MNDVMMPRESFEREVDMRWEHPDGPMVIWAGQLHWLTWTERLKLWVGWETIHDIASKRFTGYKEWHQ